jgi:hypothetical protein
MKYLRLCVGKVSEALAEILPDRIGLIFDGWTDDSKTHYVGIVAAFWRLAFILLVSPEQHQMLSLSFIKFSTSFGRNRPFS